MWAPKAPSSPLAIKILLKEVGKLSRTDEACAGKGCTRTLETQGMVVVVAVVVVIVVVEVDIVVVVVVVDDKVELEEDVLVVVELVDVVVVAGVLEEVEQPTNLRKMNADNKIEKRLRLYFFILPSMVALGCGLGKQ